MNNKPQENFPQYIRVKYYIDSYGVSGTDDQRAVQTYMDCENREMIESLRTEMIGMSHSKFKPDTLDKIVGKSRIVKYGSYEQWAKYMLMWMSAYRP